MSGSQGTHFLRFKAILSLTSMQPCNKGFVSTTEVVPAKKWKRNLFTMLAIGFILVSFVAYQFIYEDTIIVKRNWDIDLPKTYHVESLISSEPSFTGDGELFQILTYTRTIDFEKHGFKRLTLDDLQNVQALLTTFQNRTIQINDDTIVDIFKENAVSPEVGDYFYSESRNDDYDTISLLYKVKTQKLYLYEWHQ